MGIDEARRHRETSFGPPSQIIRSNEFVGEASASVEAITREVAALWKKTKKQTRDHVLAELKYVYLTSFYSYQYSQSR